MLAGREKGAPTGVVRLGACTDASLPMHARRARQDGYTALILASWNGHLEIVKALLGKGAELDAKDKVMWCGRVCESRVCNARKHAPPDMQVWQ